MNRIDEYIEKMYYILYVYMYYMYYKYFISLPVRKITFSHLTNPEMCLKVILLT